MVVLMAKIKQGFISNSSSSSFIIKLENITSQQLNFIKNYKEYDDDFYDEWSITTDDNYVKGYTDMDNCDMCKYLDKIGVPKSEVEWEDY